jgi:DNA-binding transcriptional MerR regulator
MRKNLLQLDLFGQSSETAVMEAIAEPVVMELEEATRDAHATPPAEPVVFADERIVVKIKPKAAIPKENPVTVKEETPASVPAAPAPVKPPGKRGRKSFKEIDSEVDLISIPDEETLSQKLYYSISEVAGWFKVNTSLLRYWENEFDILQPRKTRKGDRLFRVEDIKNLQLIYYLLRQRKFSIAGARNYLKTNRKKVDTQTQLVQSLTKFRSFLLELKATL